MQQTKSGTRALILYCCIMTPCALASMPPNTHCGEVKCTHSFVTTHKQVCSVGSSTRVSWWTPAAAGTHTRRHRVDIVHIVAPALSHETSLLERWQCNLARSAEHNDDQMMLWLRNKRLHFSYDQLITNLHGGYAISVQHDPTHS